MSQMCHISEVIFVLFGVWQLRRSSKNVFYVREKKESHTGTAWGLVNDDKIVIFWGWTSPFNLIACWGIKTILFPLGSY